MAGSTVSPVFVQLPHPKDEHDPGIASRQPWNTGEHRRKFLRSDGSYITGEGSHDEGTLVFWGEWEPPSYVVKPWSRESSLPRFLHEPVWEHPSTSEWRQNTDPWVFGDCFRYSSNCKQHSQRALRELAPGSLILFGSTLDREFVIDTLFVVRDSCTFVPNVTPPDIDDVFRVCTIEALGTDQKAAGKCFTLYRGATYEAPVNGLYSFVPCRRADNQEARFCRPSVSLLKCYVDPKSWRGPRGAKKPRSIAELRELWEKIRQQVLDADCLLGVSFATPRFDSTLIGSGRKHGR